MSRYKRFRVTLTAVQEIAINIEMDAASPDHALRVARKRFQDHVRKNPYLGDIEGVAGTEDHGWTLKRKPQSAEEIAPIPDPSASDTPQSRPR